MPRPCADIRTIIRTPRVLLTRLPCVPLRSPPGYANQSRPGRDFVRDLYVAFLDREPDAGGWDAWTNAVPGAGRTVVMDGFANSGEFDNRASTLYREVYWLVSDHLGTPRMIADRSGTLAGVRRHDYLPFGEEIGAGVGGRTTNQGYSQLDGVRNRYTGKERDDETGLDYFLARHYSPTQGRFTGVDPENAGANPPDPQSWNGYAYARSNPVLYTDPDGREYLICDPNGKNCGRVGDDDFYKDRRNFEGGGLTFTGNRDFFENGQIRDGDGNVIATYVQISIDDPTRQFIFEMRRRTAPIPKATLTFFGLGVAGGATGGAAYYYLLAPAMAPAVTTLGLRAAPLLPVVPSALDKLRNLGLSIEQANAIVQSPASRKLIDNANGGNVNVIQNVGGKLVRITLDPTGQRIISAGIVRANQITNGVANGRFVEKK